MSNIRRAAKRDSNEPAIVDALKGAGAHVEKLNGGSDGLPDLLVGHRGSNFLIEVKHPIGEKGASKHSTRLTDGQERWHGEWSGESHVARTAQEALWIIKATKEAPCVRPNSKIEKCVGCGSPVHTCEWPEPFGHSGDYRCPRHPDGYEIVGKGWCCGKTACGWELGS